MSVKKYLVAMVFTTNFLLLTACTTPAPQPPKTLSGQLNQICRNLKQEITIDASTKAPEQFGNNPAKEAQLYKEYNRYQCDEVLHKGKHA